MANSDDPFRPDSNDDAPAAGRRPAHVRRRRACSSAAVTDGTGRRAVAGGGKRNPRARTQPARPGSQPPPPPGGTGAETASPTWTWERCAGMHSTKCVGSKTRLAELALVTRPFWRRDTRCVPASTKPCLQRPGGIKANGRNTRCWFALHREAWGGEKFFDMLERMSKDPARYIDLLELQYPLLAFGFEGKYGRDTRGRGQEHLRDVQADLYKLIRQHRGGTPQRALSLRWRGVQDRRNPLVRYVPWWIVALAALPILVLTFTTYYRVLAKRAEPIELALSNVSLDRPVPVSTPVPDKTLKQLLAPEERQGLLTISEIGAVTQHHTASLGLVRLGECRDQPGLRAALQPDYRCTTRSPAPCSSVATLTTNLCTRSNSPATTNCRAHARTQ